MHDHFFFFFFEHMFICITILKRHKEGRPYKALNGPHLHSISQRLYSCGANPWPYKNTNYEYFAQHPKECDFLVDNIYNIRQ